MKKKTRVLILLILLLGIAFLFFSFASAQDELAEAEEEIEGLVEGGQKVTKKVESTGKFLEEKKWQYLGGEWRKTFLNNTFIASLDYVLNQLDFVFFIVIGEEYNLSMNFLFAVVIWLSFFVIFADIFKLYSFSFEYTSSIIAFGLSVIIAHLGVYSWLSAGLFKIIFYKTGIWSWVLPLLVLLAYILIFFYVRNFIKFKIIKKLKAQEKETLEHKVEKHEAFIKGVEKGVK